MSDDQSVKNILEDIKKAISGSANLDDREDILYLNEEYLQNKNDLSNEKQEETIEEKIGKQKEESEEEHDVIEQIVFNNKLNGHAEKSDKTDGYEGNLMLKENIEEIKILLSKINSKLQQQRPSLSVEELVRSLLKPQLSEWLNTHLYELVKEIVEKELKNIINNR
ncbi:hypothetical protein BIY23_02685 [Wolbachia pipientis]|uniref:DUF2497 domain-containing protein n=1 Tax=Wolbachia pipientis TaxID=955 RepID=A0A1E7QJV4_WOLPI|nr:DUF2497 domain-containing protein [Wolbachia pipientis]OEY86733.1 hypothetical protein BIY23_02685 [Wolbachia pipientis]